MKTELSGRKCMLTNPIVFAEVMRDPELCKALIERILPGKKVKELRLVKAAEEMRSNQGEQEIFIKGPETEKSISVGLYAKSVRLDVFFEGEDEWYNLEMQVENIFCPPKRSRYYHAVDAVVDLKRGRDYDQLRPGYVIFICMFDYFKAGAPVYEFEMWDHKKGLKLNDGQVTIFLNGACLLESVPDGLKGFYRYLQTSEVSSDDQLIQRMEKAVRNAVEREEVKYKVTLYDDAVRLKNIIDRQTAEIEKQNAEIEKQNAEIEKRNAEIEKQNAEIEKQSAEIEKQSAEIEKRNAELTVRDAERELSRILLGAGRSDDLARSLEDAEFREVLLGEFGLL